METNGVLSDNDNTTDGRNTIATPGTVNTEDTFIIIQTKCGQTSKRIPFHQFLEKVVGVKWEKNSHLDISDLFNPDAVAKLEGGSESSQAKSKSDPEMVIESTAAHKLEKKGEQTTVSQPAAEHAALKPRGRGRPRKVKVQDAQGMEISRKKFKGQVTEDNGSKVTNNKLTISQQPPTCTNTDISQMVQSPRRSRRTPAKNSRFKEDFVDSSTMWSKGTSSWNTQLMTLALAAERHETKPSKHSSLSRKRNGASNNDDPVTKTQEVEGEVIEEECSDMKEFDEDVDEAVQELSVKEQDDREMSENESLKLSTVEYEPSGQLLKRPLNVALDFALSRTREALSEKRQSGSTINEDGEYKYVTPYYVIMEPKAHTSGHGILIQRSIGGITFNVAEISGRTPFEKSNPCLLSYPQDRLFTCDSCDLVFLSASTWLQHKQQIHDDNIEMMRNSETLCKDIHQCPLCEDKFPFQFMLDNHLKKNQHDENVSFPCALCKLNFTSRKERTEHLHLAHPAHKCALCGKTFDDCVELRRHLKNVCCSNIGAEVDSEADNSDIYTMKRETQEVSHEIVRAPFQEGEHATASSNQKVSCDLCNIKFYTYSGLWHHKLNVHQEFYPPGFKEKLLERLEKNVNMLKSTLTFDTTTSKEEKKNNYFVVMQPKWLKSKHKLKVGIENKEFRFTVAGDKNIIHSDEAKTENTAPESLLSSAIEEKYIQFECNECNEFFQFASGYREHRSRVHGECFAIVRSLGAFQCSQCSDTFPFQFMLDEHILQHDGKTLLPCTLCGLSFHRIQDRREHWRKIHPGIGCPNCGKTYASIKYLQKHISLNCQDHYPASKKFTNFQKKQHNDFEMEDTEKRVEKKILKCHLCPKVCSSIHCWRRHMSEKHENDGFSKLSNTCIICHKVIYGYKALGKHLLQEHAEESGLPIEEENTIVKEALSRSKMDIINYQKAGKDLTNIAQDEDGLYHCPECPKTHPDLKALMIHIKTHVNMQLECSICNNSYKNPTLLKQHVMRHRTTAVYTCSTCGKKFVTLQKLNKHNKVHHCKENFVCELCGMSFTLNDYLLKHKRCHTDKRPHCCSVCGKSFRTKPELRVHVLIHTQETPYVCEHCGRGFTQKGNWRIHLAQHTGHKPHQCNQCDLSFALPSHLKRHLLTHDQKVNYRCIWCDKECTQRKHMQMHVARVHREDFFQFEEQMKLETPVPIAPSQLKMYNRRLGKEGQVRKAYRTRAKKCNTSSHEIIKGVAKEESKDEGGHSVENLTMETIIEPMVETVTTELGLAGQEIPHDGSLQILVSGDHQSYAKHGATGELIGDEPSNVEIVMRDNHEINIIINSGDHAIGNDLAVGEALEEGASAEVSLSHFAEHSSQLHDTLQQAVNALVSGSKVNGEEAMALDIESLGHGSDTYAIVYPP